MRVNSDALKPVFLCLNKRCSGTAKRIEHYALVPHVEKAQIFSHQVRWIRQHKAIP